MIDFHHTHSGDANARPVLFLHGFMGGAEDWSPIMSSFSDEFHCFAIDLPGHGKTRTDCDKDFEMVNCARAIIEWLEARNLTPCHLVGYSMGGRLALWLASNFPEKFSRVVIESGSPGLRTGVERKARRTKDAQLAKKIISEPFSEFLNNWYRMPLFGSLLQRPGAEMLLERRRKNAPKNLAKSLEKMGTGSQPNLWPRLKNAEPPVLLICGGDDEKYRRIHEEMAAMLPDARRCVIPDATHNTHFENPTEFTHKLKSFLLN